VATTALALTSGSLAVAADTCDDATLVPNADNLDRVREATLCLVNVQRARHDLAPLSANDELTKAAQAYSARMVRDRFFAHVTPAGTTLTSRIRKGTDYLGGSVRDWSLGENLAWGSRSLGTPRATVRAWMASSGHRHNILNGQFRDIGVGVAPGAPATVRGRAATYTTEFGYRATG
jgi:uncharacterized protein YkwD